LVRLLVTRKIRRNLTHSRNADGPELLGACVRPSLRMDNPEILHIISPSNESTIAVEVVEARLMRKYKHTFVFENYTGKLYYSPDQPEKSRLNIDIDARSIVCRDRGLKANKQRRMADHVREVALEAKSHPKICFSSSELTAKPLRGFVMQGSLDVRGRTQALKMNVVFNSRNATRFQIDADAICRLSDFGIKPPSAFFGMIETKDEAVIHLLLWTTPVV
jgi:polyisoprenoid-binding protein YceI